MAFATLMRCSPATATGRCTWTRPAEAATSLEHAAELSREVDNPMIEGVSLLSLASLQGRRGNTQEALELFREVIAHGRARGDYTHQLTTLRNSSSC